jgi:RimJ/RimL family protein N-acetyltransferase
MIYGIAPRWRGRGLASRAVRLAARWAATLPGVKTIELRIDRDMIECQHVAANAGFVGPGPCASSFPAPGRPSRTCDTSWSGAGPAVRTPSRSGLV